MCFTNLALRRKKRPSQNAEKPAVRTSGGMAAMPEQWVRSSLPGPGPSEMARLVCRITGAEGRG